MPPPRTLRELRSLGALAILSLLAALALVAFALLPLAVLLARALWGLEPGHSPWLDALSSPRTWSGALHSLWISAGTSLVTVLLGVPPAWLMARTDLPGASALRTALAMPYAIPPWLLAIGWITLLNPRSGLLNDAWRLATGATEPLFDLYSIPGMIFVLGLAYFPLVMLQVSAALASMDPSLEEAARTSGARPLRVAWEITLPLVMPAIGSGALLTFLIALASFGVPYLIGHPGRVEVLTTAIYNAIDVGTPAARAEAIALASLLGLVAALALALNGLLVRRGRALLGGKAGRPSLVALGRWRWVAAAALWALVALSLFVPLATLLLTSLTGAWGLGLSWDNLSLVNYREVLQDRRTLGAIWLSTWLAAATATLCVLIAAAAAWLRARTQLPGRRALPFLAELPYAIPGTVLAMGLLLTFSQDLWLGLGGVLYLKLALLNTASLLLIAYCVKFLAFGLRGADAALTQLDPSLEEAARTCGASPLRVFAQIVLPLMRPSLVAAWVLIFLPALGEVTMSILLFGPQTRTLGVLLFDYQSYESPPRAAVLATLLAAAVLLGNLAVKRLSKGKLGI
jgi:iron(III) transport system permease protein